MKVQAHSKSLAIIFIALEVFGPATCSGDDRVIGGTHLFYRWSVSKPVFSSELQLY